MSSNRTCTRCLQSQPSINYMKNVASNTYFKTCSTCRNRDKARRRNTLQRSPFETSNLQDEVAESSINNQVIVNTIPNNQCSDDGNMIIENTNVAFGNANFIDPSFHNPNDSNLIHCKGCKTNRNPTSFYDSVRNRSFKRCHNCRRRDYDRRHPESLRDQPDTRPQQTISLSLYPPSVEPFNAVTDTVNVRCRKCRKNYPSELFANPGSNSLYATCLDCRTEEHARRYPTVFEPTTIQGPSEYLDVDDADDEEVEQLAANIGMFEIVEEENFNGPVPEEAPLGDDPIFMLSQIQSREFRNHDEIQKRLQADEEINGINNPDGAPQVDDPNIDPFLEELPQAEIYNDNNLENVLLNDPFVEENSHAQNNVVQSQSYLQIDPFLESNPPPQAEGEVIEAPPRRV
ncbi:hypothetical protein EV44_g3390 [Erysiphe necator]|uniref:Uncharacterized protein n=1 Tax=Uncinula necator TaxID=52586 RepID=A0A0B1PAS5_UNCNE|nr:hypothetical protein EV44_g3390 [Erysiphe necator]